MSAGRSSRAAALLAGIVVLVALVTFGIRHAFAPDFESADRITIFSIDGRGESEPGPNTDKKLYGFPVLGKVVVTDPAEKQRLAAALREGMEAKNVMQSKCFVPRHVVRAERGDRFSDYVICFHCQNYEVHVNGEPHARPTKPISNHVRPTIEKPLLDANVPIAPD
jgi:hypothetical protein